MLNVPKQDISQNGDANRLATEMWDAADVGRIPSESEGAQCVVDECSRWHSMTLTSWYHLPSNDLLSVYLITTSFIDINFRRHFLSCRIYIFFYRHNSLYWAMASSLLSLHYHTQDTLNSVELLWTSDQSDAKTPTWQHNIHRRQTAMPPVGFEPTIPASEWPQTHTLFRAATGIGFII